MTEIRDPIPGKTALRRDDRAEALARNGVDLPAFSGVRWAKLGREAIDGWFVDRRRQRHRFGGRFSAALALGAPSRASCGRAFGLVSLGEGPNEVDKAAPHTLGLDPREKVGQIHTFLRHQEVVGVGRAERLQTRLAPR